MIARIGFSTRADRTLLASMAAVDRQLYAQIVDTINGCAGEGPVSAARLRWILAEIDRGMSPALFLSEAQVGEMLDLWDDMPVINEGEP